MNYSYKFLLGIQIDWWTDPFFNKYNFDHFWNPQLDFDMSMATWNYYVAWIDMSTGQWLHAKVMLLCFKITPTFMSLFFAYA